MKIIVARKDGFNVKKEEKLFAPDICMMIVVVINSFIFLNRLFSGRVQSPGTIKMREILF